MSDETEENLLRPVINACYPATLTTLILAVLQVTGKENLTLRLILSLNALLFLFCTFLVFLYTIYPWRKWLWTCTAVSFILGLFGSLLSVMLILI